MPGNTSFWIILILLANLVVPVVLGTWLSRRLRMKDMANRFTLTILAIMLSASPFIFQAISGHGLMNAIPLGIDLAGGTNLVWQVDEKLAKDLNKRVDTQSMDLLVQAIKRRINPSGAEEVTVRTVGTDRIEVIIPGANPEEVERKKRLMNDLGSLEFSLLANNRDHADLLARGRSLPDTENEIRDGDNVRARFVKVAKTPDGNFKMSPSDGTTLSRSREVDGNPVLEYLVLVSPDAKKITGEYLTNAYQTMDSGGGPAVGFTFNKKGAYLFESLTTQYRPKKDGFKSQLAILLNDEIQSAPNLNDVISDSGQISGQFTMDEVRDLIGILNAGALELPIKKDPINEFTISPTLGIDVQQKGMASIAVAMVAVFVFMLIYYGTAGIIADLCLLLNLVMVLGAMALINATMSLPGLAGLVLTIGMTVDANVLIYERMREELAKGSSLRMAINNGFDKAFSSIMDSNVTSLITAVILYYIGTDQVKGFAVTLFIGIITGVFTSVYVGRLLFEIVERKRLLKSFKMRNLFGKTNIDFLSYGKYCVAGSLLLIAVGLVAFAYRGQDNYDIDFTGGSMVTFQFDKEPESIDEARDALAEKLGSNISLERLRIPSTTGGAEEIFYRLRTTNENVDEVRNQIDAAFASSEFKLHKVNVTVGQVAEVKAAPVAGQEPAADAAATARTVDLKFTEDLTPSNVSTIVAQAIENELAKQNKTVEKLDSQFELTGTSGPGMSAEEGSSKTFDGFKMTVQPAIPGDVLNNALAAMTKEMADKPIFFEVNTFAAAVAGETRSDAVFAMLASIIAIVIYIWFRFEHISYGVAAAVALFHDVLVVVGLVAMASLVSGNPVAQLLGLNDFKINLAMIASFLTLVGYSLNDTIVIFDRIREVKGKSPVLTYDMINQSVNATLSRTILTSMTTFIVVVILYFFGGEGIHGFAFVLLTGIIVGSYSTIYVANPFLLYFVQRSQQKKLNPPSAGSLQKAKV